MSRRHFGSEKGYITSKSMEGIEEKIKELVDEYCSSELLSKNIVIRYVVQTTCSYCKNGAGEIVPNGDHKWRIAEKDGYKWESGTKETHATSREAFGLLIYAEPFSKEVYKYKSGRITEEYNRLGDIPEENYYLDFLNSFVGMTTPNFQDKPKEIDYTEDIARFFVELLVSVCKMNENIKNKLTPEAIKEVAESGQKLLT